MRALLLLALGVVSSFAAVAVIAPNIPGWLLVAGFVVVAVAFAVLAGAHIRRVTAVEAPSSCAPSVTRLHSTAGAGRSARVPAPAGSSPPEGRVA